MGSGAVFGMKTSSQSQKTATTFYSWETVCSTYRFTCASRADKPFTPLSGSIIQTQSTTIMIRGGNQGPADAVYWYLGQNTIILCFFVTVIQNCDILMHYSIIFNLNWTLVLFRISLKKIWEYHYNTARLLYCLISIFFLSQLVMMCAWPHSKVSGLWL